METIDRLLEAIALDEAHGVVEATIGVGPEPINRDDARVLEPTGDLGLEQKPLAADRIVGVLVEYLLDGDLAMQLAIERDEYRPQPAPGMRPKDPKPLAIAGRLADGIRGCQVEITVFGRPMP